MYMFAVLVLTGVVSSGSGTFQVYIWNERDFATDV